MGSRESARGNREPVQPGNPHQLTLEQHVHSAACIRRFADASGRVLVLRRGAQKPFPTKPTASVFCARRSWGEKLERGLFRRVEDRFQRALDTVSATGQVDHEGVTEYLIVWSLRDRMSYRTGNPVELRTATASGLSKDEEERLEKNGIGFIRSDGSIPDRLANFIPAMQHFDMLSANLRHVRWRVGETAGARRFVCPDAFSSGGVRVLPVTPSLVLLPVEAGGDEQRVELDDNTVDEVNKLSLDDARHLVFGSPKHLATAVAGHEFASREEP